MIITRISLQNYKQYRGEVTLDVPEYATIGVLGANGVGKTTIFEAIEWCLYKPSGINNADIRPRGTGGEVKVVLQLTTNDGAKTYEIERLLKRSSVQAAIYELNEIGGGEPIVQGTREVTDYISTKLIGLGHAAFVATFFTRQKELSFFGTMRPADRRREVGKLLGLETIKQAQGLIAEERKAVNADADSLQRQYDAKVKDRDLEAEITEAQEAIDTHRQTVDEATAALQTAEKATASTEERVQALQELRDRHHAAAAELRNLETRHQHAIERRDSLASQLTSLDKREQERAGLATTAKDEPSLRKEQEHLEAERERYQRRQQLLAEVDGCHRALESAKADARKQVQRAAQATDHPDWRWTDADDDRPLDAIDRLHAVAATADPVARERHLADLKEVVAADADWQQQTATLTKYQTRQRDLITKVERLERVGDPATQRVELEFAISAARTRKSDAQAQVESVGRQLATAQEVVRKLEHQHFEDSCPTCGRAFSNDEAATVIATMRETIRQHQSAIAAARTGATDAEEEITGLQQGMTSLQERETEINATKARIASAGEYIQQQARAAGTAEARRREALARLGGAKTLPAPDDITAAERALAHARLLAGTDEPLRMVHHTVIATQEAEARHRKDLEALVDIGWDPERYRDVAGRHDAAMQAASAVEQIDRELARRPQLEHDRAAAEETITELTGVIAEQRQALAAIGFDAEQLAEATTAFQAARQQEREAQQRLAQAERALHQTEHRLDLLQQEQAQVANLLAQANAKRAEKAELDMMYSEFSEFDRFVAQKQSPLLSETTSDIVAELTDGRYTRVEFDEDYGIQVHDDTGDRYPLETFSGGERDAISLAARLALSRLIGSQAANPPGFLVLDEVFGSLDADRRERVLTLLGQHSTEFFRQMFIVSHVDDVQQSPVFDTIWKVVETEDGSSEVAIGAGESEAILAD